MKKYLIALLYASILISTSFTNASIDAYAKIDNYDKKALVEKIEDTNIVLTENINNENDLKEEQEIVENEQQEPESSNVVQTSITYEETTPYVPTITYGTYGRLYVSGFNVALYDYNVNTYSDSSLQQLVDNWDSAAYYANKGRLVIADHDTQGFSVLTGLSEGTTAYIQFEDGSTIWYRLIKKSKGYNTGPDLVDTEGNSFYDMDSDLIMYTCYDGGIMVTLWVLS